MPGCIVVDRLGKGRGMTELQELKQLRDNVRRIVYSLEECWNCRNVCEAVLGCLSDGSAAWLCEACRTESASRVVSISSKPGWPFGPKAPRNADSCTEFDPTEDNLAA